VKPVSKIEHALVVTQAKAKEQLDEEVQLEREDLVSVAHAKPMETLPEGRTSETRLLSEVMPLIIQDRDAVKPEWEFDGGLFGRKIDSLKIRKERTKKSMLKNCYVRNVISIH